MRPDNRDAILPAMPQPLSAVFPPIHQTSVKSFSPVYAPLTASTSVFPPWGTLRPDVFNRDTNYPPATSQTDNLIVHPPLAETLLSPSTSPVNSCATQHQAPYDSDSGESRHSADDYMAAVTLACGFKREN